MAKVKELNGEAGTAITPAMLAPMQMVSQSWSAIKSMAEAIQLAEIVAKANALPDCRNAGMVLLKILAGAEMGYGPFASMVDVHIIEGKPSIGAHLKAASIKRSDRYDYEVVKHSRQECEIAFYERLNPAGGEMRKGTLGWIRKPETVRMTIKEAIDCGLAIGKDGIKRNWSVSPDDMLFARCISKGFRRYCPDLTGGVLAYDPDELDNAHAGVPELPAPVAPAPAQIESREITDAEIVPAEKPKADPSQQTASPLAISSEQVDKIGVLMGELNLTGEQIAKGLAKYGVDHVRKLTAAQAVEVIGNLAKKAAQKKAG